VGDRSRLPNEIWLADLLTAWRDCKAVTVADRLMVASLLGYTKRSDALADRLSRSGPETNPQPYRTILRRAERRQADSEPVPRDVAARLIIVHRRKSTVSEPEESLGPALPLETAAHIRYEPPLEPLFEAQYQRQILYALAATMAAEGDFDIGSLVSQMASGQPVRNPRRKQVLTLRRGVQLLLDRGEAMTLFFGDQRALLAALRPLVGPERVQLLHFAGCPTRGAGPGPRHQWARYEVPPPRTKVIVVSEFGIAPPRGLQQSSTTAEWIEFAETLRGAECDLIGLVPYPPHRWPRALAGTVKLVQWDRATRFSVVRQRWLRESAP